MLPGKFLRVRKVFARITEKYLVNCPNTFKTTQIFPDDCQFSGLFQNCPDFSRWQPIFRIISKLSGFFQMTANFPDDFKTVRMFQVTANFPDDFKTVQIFPDAYQFSRCFQNCPDFPDDCRFSRSFPISVLGGGVPRIRPKENCAKKGILCQKTPLFHLFQPILVHFNVHFGPFLALLGEIC